MVEVKDLHESTLAQIDADLASCRAADGLVLSWDLWRVPTDRLELVRARVIDRDR